MAWTSLGEEVMVFANNDGEYSYIPATMKDFRRHKRWGTLPIMWSYENPNEVEK
jgi:hypothetical protein